VTATLKSSSCKNQSKEVYFIFRGTRAYSVPE